MFCELMGICFSCRRPTNNRINSKIDHISDLVASPHVRVEEQRRPSLEICESTLHESWVMLLDSKLQLKNFIEKIFVSKFVNRNYQ